MDNQLTDDRFLRTKLLLGEENLEILKQAKVTIVGLGAVGAFVGEALVRSGIQNLHLIDFDKVSITNLNRCILALEENIGKYKVDIAKERYLKINHEANIVTDTIFGAKDTFDKIITPTPDILIDAIDSVNPKVDILECASKTNIDVISSMGAGLKIDPLSVRVSNIFKTKNCTLAKWVRKNLRKRGVLNEITCVYSEEQPHQEALFSYEESSSEVTYHRGRERRSLGSMVIIPGIFGLTIAHLAIQKIISKYKIE